MSHLDHNAVSPACTQASVTRLHIIVIIIISIISLIISFISVRDDIDFRIYFLGGIARWGRGVGINPKSKNFC